MLLQTYSGESHVNVGSGEDVTILELTRMVMDAVGFAGEIVRDTGKPDGTPRKLMSAERLKAMGWSPSIPLPEGIAATYRWFLEHRAGVQ
jgi:GDP-L-fucose synthase